MYRYASYYEALLRSQYNQLYQKNQEVEHYRTLAEAIAQHTKEEALVFMGDHTHSLILGEYEYYQESCLAVWKLSSSWMWTVTCS